jgi:hypothetical protein
MLLFDGCGICFFVGDCGFDLGVVVFLVIFLWEGVVWVLGGLGVESIR